MYQNCTNENISSALPFRVSRAHSDVHLPQRDMERLIPLLHNFVVILVPALVCIFFGLHKFKTRST